MKTNLNVDTQALRERILDLAMRGKLVKQEAGDDPASVLLEKIKAEKAELVKEGKIKKSKKLPEIIDDEKPFDIPDSWEWVRLGDVSSNIHYGFTASAQETGNAKLLRITDIQDGKVDWSKVPFCNISEEKENGLLLKPNDVLIARTGGTVGKSFVIQNVPEKTVFASYLIRIQTIDTDIVSFLEYFLRSPLYWKSIESKKSGTGQPNVNATKLSEIVFPFPPLAEQKRIADKVSELFKQVDIIEKNVAEYQGLEQAMRSKLLDLAMHGKLVKQDSNDEPASELLKQIQSEKAQLVKEGKIKKGKKLPEITDDEKPFDIPDSWKWVRFGNVLNIISAKRVHKSDWQKSGIPFYRAREIAKLAKDNQVDNDLFISEELFDELSKYGIPEPNDLMVTGVGTLGKTYIVKSNDKFYYKDASVLCMKNYGHISSDYIKSVMESPYMQKEIKKSSSGTTVGTLTIIRLSNYLFPLPPLDEQRRIADKVSELFEQLDIINNNLVSAS